MEEYLFNDEVVAMCPCLIEEEGLASRLLQVEEDREPIVIWKVVFTAVVLVFMFGSLIIDCMGADSVMLCVLTAFMASGIISIKEGLVGFSNEGVLSVVVLFVVADGIAKTGALDWYMVKLLGKPKTLASAQIRLMAPIIIVSAFLNNTPLVVVMIPIVQRWARNAGIPVQQLMIHLSFASVLGGTCTLIGTSTNLVVAGLLKDSHPEIKVGMFDLAIYGVPNALLGFAYILFASPFLLPGAKDFVAGDDKKGLENNEDEQELLLGARVTPWSPAAGRTIQRSGLRNTGGVYLVSVRRAGTGHLHRAVSGDFVLNVGDTMYFTSADGDGVEHFGEFCEEHGLEVVTSDHEDVAGGVGDNTIPDSMKSYDEADRLKEDNDARDNGVPTEVGVTKASLLQADNQERLRGIARMADMIQGIVPSQSEPLNSNDPAKIVVTTDKDQVVIGITTMDRPGLLLDISKCILRLKLTLRHTEAAVVGVRSVSIWRCTKVSETEQLDDEDVDVHEIWSVLSSLLSETDGIQALKQRGIRVIRARVTNGSRLINNTAQQIGFKNTYNAAVVAIQSSGKCYTQDLAKIQFKEGDLLILQANNNSALLRAPPADFYSASFSAAQTKDESEETSDIEHASTISLKKDKKIWRDLQVLSSRESSDTKENVSEFLTAMKIAPGSQLCGKSVKDSGIQKLPDVHLVSLERRKVEDLQKIVLSPKVGAVDIDGGSFGGANHPGQALSEQVGFVYTPIDLNDPLKGGDVLWFSGPANAIGDLRKVPGLISNENDQVGQLTERIHDRRLVQAVVSRNGTLVGKTVRDVKFRTKYGAAVIAVQREGKRVYEQPGRIKLQAGDVLLLEAGKAFLAKKGHVDRDFALFAEVEDSAPPRLNLLIPALLITVAAIGVYTAGLASLVTCGLCASILMVVTGILSEQEARDAVNWETYITIASAFGIGTALVNSGVAGAVADFLVRAFGGTGEAGILGAIYLSTFLISNIVTNNAAAALIFPIAMGAATQTGTDPKLMCYSVMLGASACFASPFGYTTNLLVYGPGKYKFMDFVKLGSPMQIILWVASIAFLSVLKVWISWVASAGVLALVIAIRICNIF